MSHSFPFNCQTRVKVISKPELGSFEKWLEDYKDCGGVGALSDNELRESYYAAAYRRSLRERELRDANLAYDMLQAEFKKRFG